VTRAVPLLQIKPSEEL